MPNLSEQDFEKITQLSQEMSGFPPHHFADENILSWSKYFGVAPQNLAEYTSKTAKILLLAENMAKQDQGIPLPVLTAEQQQYAAEKDQETAKTRGINPIFNSETFDFLWLQTLLILAPQSDSNILDRDFSPYFKMAAYLINAQEILEDLKNYCDHYQNPETQSALYNGTLALIHELKIMIEKRDFEGSKTLYNTLYKLNLKGLDISEIKLILKKAPPEIKDQFLISEELAASISPEEIQDHSNAQNPENLLVSIQAKLASAGEKFNEAQLSFFNTLDIKFDDTQKEAFITQMKGLLLKISQQISLQAVNTPEGKKPLAPNLSIEHPENILKEAPIVNMLNKKETTAITIAQSLANLLFSTTEFTRKEIKVLFEALQKAGIISPKISISMIMSALGETTTQGEETVIINASTAKTSFEKFKEKNQFLVNLAKNLTQSLYAPYVLAANRDGLYRTALMFYLITAAGKGPALDTRKPTVKSWISDKIRALFGNAPPSKIQREISRLNKLKGWSTRENVFPPPFNPEAQKEKAIALFKEHCRRIGKPIPDDSMIAQNAVSFYFSQSIVLTHEFFDELYEGIMSLRIKLENALFHPSSPIEFSQDEIKKLSTYMNILENDVTKMLEQRQQEELLIAKDHLIFLEYAHQSLQEVYEADHGNIIHPLLAEFSAFQDGLLSGAEDVIAGNRVNIEYGVSPSKPLGNTSPTATAPAGSSA
jgi:hypothetical protein